MISRSVLSVFAAFLLSFLGAVQASATETPTCDQPGVIQAVSSRFERNNREFLGKDLAIAQIGRIKQSVHVAPKKSSEVERRFCRAKITTTDGRKRDLWYLIEGGMGFVGLGHSVEFCTVGLDPWFVYGAYCKSVRW